MRRVVLAGATGLVGQSILAGLLADATVGEVHVVARRASLISHAKLRAHVVDFTDLPVFPAVDEVYLALGTTIKVAGSQSAFRAVDLDANLAVARAARAAGATRAGLVSAMGADARSSVFYNRVKGELEDALLALGFDALVVARPSLLLAPLIPQNYRAIDVTQVALALLARVPVARGVEVLLSGSMQPR